MIIKNFAKNSQIIGASIYPHTQTSITNQNQYSRKIKEKIVQIKNNVAK